MLSKFVQGSILCDLMSQPWCSLLVQFDDTRERMQKLGELLNSQQASETLSCEKPNDF